MTSVAATQVLPTVATASVASDFLVISIHDIAPSNRETVQKIISELATNGVRVCSLLVVPDYHHQGLAVEDGQFVSWLRDLESHGHEIVIHGYFHQRPRGPNETLRKVRDLRSGEDFSAWSLVYSVRSEWRRGVSLAWNAGLRLLVREKPLLRLSIHPPDYYYPAVWRQIVDLIKELDEVRTSTTYRDWIAEQRMATNQGLR